MTLDRVSRRQGPSEGALRPRSPAVDPSTGLADAVVGPQIHRVPAVRQKST
jgi:hypothetical protein